MLKFILHKSDIIRIDFHPSPLAAIDSSFIVIQDTNEIVSYLFSDDDIKFGRYQYRLKQIDYDVTFEYSNSIEFDGSIPENLTLQQNYPNPFNQITTTQYSIPKRSNVVLEVYDVLGNKVAVIVDEAKERGVYAVNFDASPLASGIYLYRLQAVDFVETKKMVLMK